MVEIIVATFIGGFMWDNAEFMHTAKEQLEDNHTWHYSPQDASKDVPNIAIADKVIWILQTDDNSH